MREAIARAGVAFAVLLGFLGQLVTFVPGAEAGWHGVAAVAAILGIASSRLRLRVFAAILAVFLAWLSWEGHLEGRRYRNWQAHQTPPNLALQRTPHRRGTLCAILASKVAMMVLAPLSKYL